MIDSVQSATVTTTPSGTGALRVVIYVLLAIGLMLADHHGSYIGKLKSSLSVIAYPIVYLVEWPSKAGAWISRTWVEHDDTVAINQRLESQMLQLQSELSRMRSLQSENNRLRTLLNAAPRVQDRTLVADIVDIDLDPYSHQIAISLGAVDNIVVGQPLVDASGVVGQISSVSPLISNALMISDPSHAIPVTVNRTGLRGIAYGMGRTDQIEMRDIPISSNLVEGDLLVTSGMGGRFPTGIPVATVTQISRPEDDAFLTVLARPAADLGRIHQVLVVWPNEGDETAPEPEAETDVSGDGS